MRELALLEPPYRLAVTIFRDSIRAFGDGDYELARTLKAKDRELDALTDGVMTSLSNEPLWTRNLCQATWTTFVARALERIGDHATNIAEDSFWRDQAADIRHS